MPDIKYNFISSISSNNSKNKRTNSDQRYLMDELKKRLNWRSLSSFLVWGQIQQQTHTLPSKNHIFRIRYFWLTMREPIALMSGGWDLGDAEA